MISPAGQMAGAAVPECLPTSLLGQVRQAPDHTWQRVVPSSQTFAQTGAAAGGTARAVSFATFHRHLHLPCYSQIQHLQYRLPCPTYVWFLSRARLGSQASAFNIMETDPWGTTASHNQDQVSMLQAAKSVRHPPAVRDWNLLNMYQLGRLEVDCNAHGKQLRASKIAKGFCRKVG